MTPEQLQGLLHMRKRNWVQKNGKAYNRKKTKKELSQKNWIKWQEYLSKNF